MADRPNVIVAGSARRHGVKEDDVLHAHRNAGRVFDLGKGFTMVIGPDRTGRLLEVGFVVSSDDTIVIVHAMTARKKFLR